MMREEVLNSSRELVNRIYEKMSIIETCDSVAEKVKTLDVCFNDIDNKQVVVLEGILSPEQLAVVREGIISKIYDNAVEAQSFLERLNRKPATVNPEFEAAIQDMVNSDKKDDVIKIGVLAPDPMEEKLTDIPIEEEKAITSIPEMTLEEVKRLYQAEGRSQGYIAEYYGVKKSVVNSFLQKNHLFRSSVKKDDVFLDSKVEQRRKERP